MLVPVTVMGTLVGIGAMSRPLHEESWPRVEAARGYSMARPHFCGESLRWWSPTADGRRMESRGEGEACAVSRPARSTGWEVHSRFTNGSWNLFLRSAKSVAERRITSSDANELDPVLSPDGCAVVFASDQGRGLGSTALYRLDLAPLVAGCDAFSSAPSPR